MKNIEKAHNKFVQLDEQAQWRWFLRNKKKIRESWISDCGFQFYLTGDEERKFTFSVQMKGILRETLGADARIIDC